MSSKIGGTTVFGMHLVRDRDFYRQVRQIMVPVALQQAINIGVNMMDTMMLTACGETQLSASSLANQYISLFQIMCLGLGFGASVLTSRFGEQRIRKVFARSRP